MKNKKLWNILSALILGLQIVAEVLTAVTIIRLNILPNTYTLLVVAVFVLLAGVTAALLYVRAKKPVGKARRLIACVLALVVVCGCALVAKLATDAYKTISSVTNSGETANVRDVLVLVPNDSAAQSIADTKEFTFGIIADYNMEHTQKAIDLIGELIGQTPVIAQYETAIALAEALSGGQVDAVIINGVSLAILIEEEGYEDFLDGVRALHTIPLDQLEDKKDIQDETRDPNENMTNTPFVVYISGSDTRSAVLKISRSDVNILAVVNPISKQILLLNTPRDYYIPNPIGGGKLDKLTHCGLYGAECSMEALGDLYGMEVDYYAQINFTGFETLIDAVDGVTIYSDQSFTARDTKIKVGENHLDGAQALDLARERRAVKGGDNGRGKNQMKVIKALIEKLTNGTTFISNYSKILESLQGMFSTDVTSEDISMLVKMQLSDMASWNIQSFAVTGSGASKPSYSSPKHNAYVMIPHDNVVEYASELVDRVLAGENLTEEDMVVPK